MNFIIGQFFSLVSLVVSIVIAQFKKVKHVLLGEMLCNFTIALSFVFLGGLSGAWICIVGGIQALIIYLANTYNLAKSKRNILTVLFAVAYVIGTVLVYRGWSDILSCVCALLYIMAIVQTDSAKYRRYMAANSCLWIIYDFTVLAYVNIITHGMLLVSLIVAMIRLDRKSHG